MTVKLDLVSELERITQQYKQNHFFLSAVFLRKTNTLTIKNSFYYLNQKI